MVKFKFHVLNENNGMAYKLLVIDIIIHIEKLRNLGVYILTTKIIDSMRHMPRELGDIPVWYHLSNSIFRHAIITAKTKGINPDKWIPTSSIQGLPNINRVHPGERQSDGTVITIDLANNNNYCWMMRFDKNGIVLNGLRKVDILSGRDKKDLYTKYRKFAKAVFSRCDVLVMEDFRNVVKNRHLFKTDDYRWIIDMQWDLFLQAMIDEAVDRRLRIILVSHVDTSWTCHKCRTVHRVYPRTLAPNWRCRKCKILVDRNKASCVEQWKRWLEYSLVTYDIARSGRPRTLKYS